MKGIGCNVGGNGRGVIGRDGDNPKCNDTDDKG